MKANFVEAYLLNPSDEEVMVKIPRSFESMFNFILEPRFNFNVNDTFDETLNAESFGEFLYSVTHIEIKNFKIKEPTNIFYLNAYFLLLKQKELHVPEEELVITTEKLKEMIAELLKIEKENVSLSQIVDTLFENTEEEKEKTEQKKRFEREEYKRKRKEDDIRLPAGATLGDVDDIVAYFEADGKPIFSINKMKRLDREKRQ